MRKSRKGIEIMTRRLEFTMLMSRLSCCLFIFSNAFATLTCAQSPKPDYPLILPSYTREQLSLSHYSSVVDALEEISPETLKKQLHSPWDFTVNVSDLTGSKTQRVNTCQAYFDSEKNKLEPVKAFEFTAYQQLGSLCKAIQWAAKAKPYQESFWSQFSWSANSPSLLPKALSLTISDEARQKLKTNTDIQFWSQVEEFNSFELTANNTMLYKTSSARYEIIELVMGDFDGDSIADKLILINSGIIGASFASARLFVLKTQIDENTISAIEYIRSE